MPELIHNLQQLLVEAHLLVPNKANGHHNRATRDALARAYNAMDLHPKITEGNGIDYAQAAGDLTDYLHKLTMGNDEAKRHLDTRGRWVERFQRDLIAAGKLKENLAVHDLQSDLADNVIGKNMLGVLKEFYPHGLPQKDGRLDVSAIRTAYEDPTDPTFASVRAGTQKAQHAPAAPRPAPEPQTKHEAPTPPPVTPVDPTPIAKPANQQPQAVSPIQDRVPTAPLDLLPNHSFVDNPSFSPLSQDRVAKIQPVIVASKPTTVSAPQQSAKSTPITDATVDEQINAQALANEQALIAKSEKKGVLRGVGRFFSKLFDNELSEDAKALKARLEAAQKVKAQTDALAGKSTAQESDLHTQQELPTQTKTTGVAATSAPTASKPTAPSDKPSKLAQALHGTHSIRDGRKGLSDQPSLQHPHGDFRTAWLDDFKQLAGIQDVKVYKLTEDKSHAITYVAYDEKNGKLLPVHDTKIGQALQNFSVSFTHPNPTKHDAKATISQLTGVNLDQIPSVPTKPAAKQEAHHYQPPAGVHAEEVDFSALNKVPKAKADTTKQK